MADQDQVWMSEEDCQANEEPLPSHEAYHPSDAGGESSHLTDRRSFVKRQERWFKPGKVIQYLHITPYTNEENIDEQAGSSASVVVCGELVYVKRQRGILMTKRKGISYLIPINTYRGRGVLKQGTPAETHAVIYSEGSAADVKEEEYNRGLRRMHIKVVKAKTTFDPKSRVNFGETLTLSHNQKVKYLGKVDEGDLPALKALWKQHAPGREED